MNNAHIIQRSVIDATLTFDTNPTSVQDNLNHTYNTTLHKVIDKVFSEFEWSHSLRLDNITVDVGTISIDQLDSELPRLLEIELRLQLQSIYNEKYNVTTSKSIKPENRYELIIHLLRFGYTPWWASRKPEKTLNSLISSSLRENPDGIKPLLQKQLQNKTVALRMARQLSSETLFGVVNLIYPEFSNLSHAYIAEAKYLNNLRASPSSNKFIAITNCWESILATLAISNLRTNSEFHFLFLASYLDKPVANPLDDVDGISTKHINTDENILSALKIKYESESAIKLESILKDEYRTEQFNSESKYYDLFDHILKSDDSKNRLTIDITQFINSNKFGIQNYSLFRRLLRNGDFDECVNLIEFGLTVDERDKWLKKQFPLASNLIYQLVQILEHYSAIKLSATELLLMRWLSFSTLIRFKTDFTLTHIVTNFLYLWSLRHPKSWPGIMLLLNENNVRINNGDHTDTQTSVTYSLAQQNSLIRNNLDRPQINTNEDLSTTTDPFDITNVRQISYSRTRANGHSNARRKSKLKRGDISYSRHVIHSDHSLGFTTLSRKRFPRVVMSAGAKTSLLVVNKAIDLLFPKTQTVSSNAYGHKIVNKQLHNEFRSNFVAGIFSQKYRKTNKSNRLYDKHYFLLLRAHAQKDSSPSIDQLEFHRHLPNRIIPHKIVTQNSRQAIRHANEQNTVQPDLGTTDIVDESITRSTNKHFLEHVNTRSTEHPQALTTAQNSDHDQDGILLSSYDKTNNPLLSLFASQNTTLQLPDYIFLLGKTYAVRINKAKDLNELAIICSDIESELTNKSLSALLNLLCNSQPDLISMLRAFIQTILPTIQKKDIVLLSWRTLGPYLLDTSVPSGRGLINKLAYVISDFFELPWDIVAKKYAQLYRDKETLHILELLSKDATRIAEFHSSSVFEIVSILDFPETHQHNQEATIAAYITFINTMNIPCWFAEEKPAYHENILTLFTRIIEINDSRLWENLVWQPTTIRRGRTYLSSLLLRPLIEQIFSEKNADLLNALDQTAKVLSKNSELSITSKAAKNLVFYSAAETTFIRGENEFSPTNFIDCLIAQTAQYCSISIEVTRAVIIQSIHDHLRPNNEVKQPTNSESIPTGSQQDFKSPKQRHADPIFIQHSGAVLFWPLLKPYFQRCGIMQDNEFTSDYSRSRAIHLLGHACTGLLEHNEASLSLNKLLCGVEIDAPIYLFDDISDDEFKITQELITGVSSAVPMLKSTSIDGMRGSFFIREGKLEPNDDGWTLTVEQKGWDVLLNDLPWAPSPNDSRPCTLYTTSVTRCIFYTQHRS